MDQPADDIEGERQVQSYVCQKRASKSRMFTRADARRRSQRRKEIGNQLRGMDPLEWILFPNIFRAIRKAQKEAHDKEYIQEDQWPPS
jgi:hypothetical protein